jgi:diaminopimelate decarboxylase
VVTSPEELSTLVGHDTPAYVYDLSAVRHAQRKLRQALPEPAQLFYSLKANPHPAVLRELSALGCRAELTSVGELRAAVQAGFQAGEALYTGPGKRHGDVAEAVDAGVREFSVDSPVGLDQLERVAASRQTELRALLRVNPDTPPAGAGMAMTGRASQFGSDLDLIHEKPWCFADRPHVTLHGLHLYMGSNLNDADSLVAQFEYGIDVADQVQKDLDRCLPVLDLGGGFGAPYAVEGKLPEFENLSRRLTDLLDARTPGWRSGEIRIAFESGRYLTATSGRLVTTVLDVKYSQGKRVVVLDAGVNHLGGMSGLRRIPRVAPDLLGHSPDGTGVDEAIIAGPLCTPVDTWARNSRLPTVQPGDVLVVPNVGAYSLYASLVLFLGHPLPIEIVLDGSVEIERTRLSAIRQEP